MFRPRVIPILLLKDQGLVKTIKFKNPTYVGDPINAVKIFNELKSDELIFLDISASGQNRTIYPETVKKIGHEAFMPFSVGGGIRTMSQVQALIRAGAEKVILCTGAVERPDLIREASQECGSQSIVVCIDIKKTVWGKFRVCTHGGKKITELSPIDFARSVEQLGAGEILINNIDRDGTYVGFDLELVSQISKAVTIPVICCGGAATKAHFKLAVEAGAHAVAAGSMFVFHGSRRAVLINYPEKKDLIHWFNNSDLKR